MEDFLEFSCCCANFLQKPTFPLTWRTFVCSPAFRYKKERNEKCDLWQLHGVQRFPRVQDEIEWRWCEMTWCFPTGEQGIYVVCAVACFLQLLNSVTSQWRILRKYCTQSEKYIMMIDQMNFHWIFFERQTMLMTPSLHQFSFRHKYREMHIFGKFDLRSNSFSRKKKKWKNHLISRGPSRKLIIIEEE